MSDKGSEFFAVGGDLTRKIRNLEDWAKRQSSRPRSGGDGGTANTSIGQSIDTIPENQVIFDPTDGHNHDGANSNDIALLGDATGASTAVVVEKARGIEFPTPGAADDGKALVYDHPNTEYVLRLVETKVVTKAANYTATAEDFLIKVDATLGAVTITLPPLSTAAPHALVVKKIDASANAVTLDGNAAETIDGAATQAITVQWGSLTVVPDPTSEWSTI